MAAAEAQSQASETRLFPICLEQAPFAYLSPSTNNGDIIM